MRISVLDEETLRELAGSRSYARGQGYAGAVTRLRADDEGTVTALVHGTGVYEVTLWPDEEDGTCDCPYGQEGNFCKHCVAVGLVMLHGAEPETTAVPAQRSGPVLQEWLAARDHAGLLALITSHLDEDPEWRRILQLRAELERSADSTDPAKRTAADAAVRARVLELVDAGAFSRHGFVDYAEAHAFGDRIGEAADALHTLVSSGRTAAAVALAREAIETAQRSYGQVDDSSGYVGGAINALADAHLAACRATRPDPVETARWLTARILGDAYGTPDWDLEEYQDLLGATGLAEVRRLAEQAHARKPSGWAEKHLLESLHAASGDIDALVALYAADLTPGGYTHLRIARTLDDAGRTTEALEWAERGLRETDRDRHVHQELVDYVVQRYADAGRHTDAVAVRRDRFRSELSHTAYRLLRTTASAAGRWNGEKGERTAALALLRSAADDHARTTRSPVGAPPRGGRYPARIPYGAPALLDVLIDEGELDEAWHRADGLATGHQWLALADASARTRPADAARVYLNEVDTRKQHTGDGNYQEIAKLLLKAKACHERLGTRTDFTTYLSALRTEQKRKRNLMTILDHHCL
ncbi:SWIM zinc finger family protein [Streptomyces massasporeus]|uniref:SWIM zinc finger family protein n=1 Tax=Streptomyces massasporeus TaxID=67324 RepID=UPI0033D2C72A